MNKSKIKTYDLFQKSSLTSWLAPRGKRLRLLPIVMPLKHLLQVSLNSTVHDTSNLLPSRRH